MHAGVGGGLGVSSAPAPNSLTAHQRGYERPKPAPAVNWSLPALLAPLERLELAGALASLGLINPPVRSVRSSGAARRCLREPGAMQNVDRESACMSDMEEEGQGLL
ncbi:hypothetical protein AAFF_G00036290 [Aldrovandia affinis]|uniref:Uncharacterized protein n=1 Tax=Aldrovandia affinis TaxID=143900 RepID=A0AAD7WFR7_9TELE|nr:hypothetical protein AAFF_G00036290 [Aldrovandia affinis]